jgi:hypothetical protein
MSQNNHRLTIFFLMASLIINAVGVSPVPADDKPPAPPAPSPSPVTSAASTFTALRVDAGGNGYTDAATGLVWEADRAYISAPGSAWGFWGPRSMQVIAASHPVAGALASPVYQTQRLGVTGYQFAVPNGKYKVTLRLAELHVDAVAGKNVFDVLCQSSPVAGGVDIAKNAGLYKAYDVSFNCVASDSTLTITFIGRAGIVALAGLDIENTAAVAAPSPAVGPKASATPASPTVVPPVTVLPAPATSVTPALTSTVTATVALPVTATVTTATATRAPQPTLIATTAVPTASLPVTSSVNLTPTTAATASPTPSASVTHTPSSTATIAPLATPTSTATVPAATSTATPSSTATIPATSTPTSSSTATIPAATSTATLALATLAAAPPTATTQPPAPTVAPSSTSTATAVRTAVPLPAPSPAASVTPVARTTPVTPATGSGSMSRGTFTITFQEADRLGAMDVLDAMDTIQARLSEEVGVNVGTVEVRLFSSRDEYNAAIGVTVPADQVGNIADSTHIWLLAPHQDNPSERDDILKGIQVEVTRQVLGQTPNMPLWMRDGIASYEARLWNDARQQFMRGLVSMRRLASLRGLEGQTYNYLGGSVTAHTVIDYLTRAYGMQGLVNMVASLKTLTLEQAIQSVLGVSYSEFDRNWLNYVRTTYGR